VELRIRISLLSPPLLIHILAIVAQSCGEAVAFSIDGYSMGRCCILCGRERPNERFGGRGLRSVVCRDCMQLPKEVRACALATDEVLGFVEQKNISAKNIKRLVELESIGDATFQRLRSLVLEIARVHPRINFHDDDSDYFEWSDNDLKYVNCLLIENEDRPLTTCTPTFTS